MDDNDQPSHLNYSSTISRILSTKGNVSKEEEKFKNPTKTLRRIKTMKGTIKQSDKSLKKYNDKYFPKEKEKNFMSNFSTLKEKREEKFNLNQRGIIELAKIHSKANRPLKNLIKYNNNFEDYEQIQTCPCCRHFCITPGKMETFSMCDDTDQYLDLGEAVSMYFDFYKFSIFVLFMAFFALIGPSFIMSQDYYDSLNRICKNIKHKSFSVCDNYIKVQANNSTQSAVSFTSRFDAINLLNYIMLYNNMMNIELNDTSKIDDSHGKLMHKTVGNNSLTYFIVLITLFLLNLLFIVLQNNKILYYNFRLVSPSDYTILLTNLSYIRHSFVQMKRNYIKSKKLSHREFRKKLGFSNSELNDKSISEAMEFCAFIKKFVINKNEKYNVETINICYKLRQFQNLKEKADEFNEYLYELDNYQSQIKRNKQLKLKGNRRIYFKPFLSALEEFNLNFIYCTQTIKMMEILRQKRKKEKELTVILENSKHICKSNFTNVVIVSFSSISEQENFLEKYSKNFFQNIIYFFKNFKYIVFGCFMSETTLLKREQEIDDSMKVYPAPEPDDIIFENLAIQKSGRILRIVFTTFISFLIITISFIIVFLLTIAQERINEMSFGEKNFSKYAVSLGMTGAISVINILLQTILETLTKKEYHISLTDYNLSFSIKMAICTFLNSAIVPLISNIYANSKTIEINHDLLVSNMFMMFAVNSIVSPLMWTFNFSFFLKKLVIWKIEKKKNNQDMSQKNLNKLYEYVDIDLAYKYSYLAKTLLMTFFYLPLFPIGLVITMLGFILGFYLEKFNIGHIYKRPEMMNETICKYYTSFFEVNFFMLALGDFIFLKDKYHTNYWQYINLVVFLLLIILPYGPYLELNFLGINQSKINKQSYSDMYFTFFNDYERMNPLTIKTGRINYLKRLKDLNYLSEEEYQAKKKHIEKLSILEINLEAKPTRTNRSAGIRRDLLDNVGITESDAKARRLFELVKKLYQSHNSPNNIGDNDYSKNDENIISTSTRLENKKLNVPNILHLVGTIFGTEEEDNSLLSSLKETESEINNKDNNDNIDNIDINKDNNENIINTNSNLNIESINNNIPTYMETNNSLPININENNNKNSKINSKDNYILKREDFKINKILSQIRNEISQGKKNLLKYSEIKDDKNEPKETNEKESDKKSRKIEHFNTTRMSKDNTNTNSTQSNLPYVSNISVTINQFFDKGKVNKNTSPNNNLMESNDTIVENDQEDKKTNSLYKLSTKKIIPLFDEDDNSENIIDKRPFNNIINIVVNNDNNNNDNNNKEDKKDKVIFNEYINVK